MDRYDDRLERRDESHYRRGRVSAENIGVSTPPEQNRLEDFVTVIDDEGNNSGKKRARNNYSNYTICCKE
jgi:hypothetical protein